ncbi:MAG: hypothetical protein LQ348_003230 [Seirophora lacunosa]|nr:MAG: hypothetical protein LQ348_003230 [Seirophora lacunosa]
MTHSRPACPRLPIVPAIPRKLEKQSGKHSSMLAASTSVLSPVPEFSASRAILPTPGSLQHACPTEKPQDHSTSVNGHDDELVDSASADRDGRVGTAASSPVEAANAEDSISATNTSIPSTLDPQTPPFVPEASRTPPDDADVSSNLTKEGDIHAKQMASQALYPLQTTTSSTPYQKTPPDNSAPSPLQQSHYSHGHTSSLFYDPAAPYNHPTVNPAIYYGYSPSQNISFYPQAPQSYPSASTARSSYEGYAIANTPYGLQSRPDPPFHTSNSTRSPNPPNYPSHQSQVHYAASIPQFGSQFPMTPSATPPNSASHKQAAFPTEADAPSDSAGQTLVLDGHDEAQVPKQISQEFKEWCDRKMSILEEEPSPSSFSPLLSHLTENFNSPAYADCELYISHVSHRFEPAVVSLHSLLIAQNPKLQELLQSAEVREDGKNQILLAVTDPYTDPTALKVAIKVCYGERPSQYVGYPSELSSDTKISIAWMMNALALAAAGHFLGMPDVAHRGEQIASVVLDWHNIEQALSFAMDTSIERAWALSAESPSFPTNASELLLSCLSFVISNIPEDVQLDLAVKPLPAIDRLPVVPNTPAQSSRTRLSQIRFGDLPTETQEDPSKHDVLISKILLSLSFAHCKYILDHIPVNTNIRIAKPVVEERERRRLQALEAKTSPIEAATHDNFAPLPVERVVQQDAGGTARLSMEEVEL